MDFLFTVCKFPCVEVNVEAIYWGAIGKLVCVAMYHRQQFSFEENNTENEYYLCMYFAVKVFHPLLFLATLDGFGVPL